MYNNDYKYFGEQVMKYASIRDISTHPGYLVKRKEFAHILDSFIDPFNIRDVSHQGFFIEPN